MSAVTDRMAPGGSTGAVTASLLRRSLIAIQRLPSAFVPSLVFPIVTTIAFSGAFGAITELPFFPTDNALSWYAPLAAMQGAGFAGVFTAFAVIRDFESRFVDRLLLAPTPRPTLLLGPLLSGMVRAMFPVAAAMLVGVIGGMAVPAGVAAVVSLVVAALGISFIGGCWALGLAFRFKSMQAAPLMQIGLFFALFLSTSQMPLEGLSPWLETIARVNPMTYVLALGRQGFLGDITLTTTVQGLAAIAGLGGVLLVFAFRGLRKL